VHVIAPLLSGSVLFGALLWAAAAAALPWIVRGRSATLDILAAAAWSTAIVLAEPLVDGRMVAGHASTLPRGAVLGGVLAAAIAVAGRALRGPV